MAIVKYQTPFVMTIKKKYCWHYIKIKKECSYNIFFSTPDNNGLILSIGLGITGLVVLVLVTAAIGLFRSRKKEERHKRRHTAKKRFYDLSSRRITEKFCNRKWKIFYRDKCHTNVDHLFYHTLLKLCFFNACWCLYGMYWFYVYSLHVILLYTVLLYVW